ncbi:MAG: deoxyribose-phosphate aldolase [Lachnospiraceae bacterium]|nr:deoxyribose-phosphate aldolase [Lachnospiraceae bacterium]
MKDIAQMIDQTLLKNDVTSEQVRQFVLDAKKHPFKAICVYGAQARFCMELLEGSDILLCTVAGFPSGQVDVKSKVFEAQESIRAGAKEVDYVINTVAAKSGHFDFVEEEMKQIVSACHEAGAGCKVIFENCLMTDDEKKRLCEIASRVRPDFIKTSTGFGSGGATIEDVRLMRENVPAEVKVKAAGGIRTAQAAAQMIEAGAERIGTSGGAQIVEEYAKLQA